MPGMAINGAFLEQDNSTRLSYADLLAFCQSLETASSPDKE
jgi:hypothetical protein